MHLIPTSLVLKIKTKQINKLKNNKYLKVKQGDACYFRVKTLAGCGPHLQTSVEEEVDQMFAICKKKTLCFLTSTNCRNRLKFK